MSWATAVPIFESGQSTSKVKQLWLMVNNGGPFLAQKSASRLFEKILRVFQMSLKSKNPNDELNTFKT